MSTVKDWLLRVAGESRHSQARVDQTSTALLDALGDQDEAGFAVAMESFRHVVHQVPSVAVYATAMEVALFCLRERALAEMAEPDEVDAVTGVGREAMTRGDLRKAREILCRPDPTRGLDLEADYHTVKSCAVALLEEVDRLRSLV